MSDHPQAQGKSSQGQRIAGELQDPEQIQQQVQAQKDERPETPTAFVAPRAPIEIKLAEIWAEVLGLEQVGLHDDFFELGGHSLLATQVLSRVSREFQCEIPIELIFNSAFTIAEMSKAIAQAQIEQADTQNLETLLEKLSHLSEDEARQLLAQPTEGS